MEEVVELPAVGSGDVGRPVAAFEDCDLLVVELTEQIRGLGCEDDAVAVACCDSQKFAQEVNGERVQP